MHEQNNNRIWTNNVKFLGRLLGHTFYQQRQGNDLFTLRLPADISYDDIHWSNFAFRGPVLPFERYSPQILDLLGLEIRCNEILPEISEDQKKPGKLQLPSIILAPDEEITLGVEC